MGEKDDTKTEKENKNEGDKKAAADGGEKKDDGPMTAVLKLDLHCEGCAKKVRRSVRHFEGVENAKADWSSNKLTVTGKVDPAWLRERVEYKTKKKVELVSPLPKKDAGAGGGGEQKSDDKKAEEKKPKQATPTTVLMKIKLHCDGCAHKIRRIINKNIDGVDSVTTNLDKDLVTVSGTMDLKHLTAFLKEKLNRSVEIVPPKKDESGGDRKGKEGGAGGGEEKKEGGGEKKEAGGEKKEGGGEKKEGEAKATGSEGSQSEEKKVEVNKLEYQGYNPSTHYAIPMYSQSYVHNDANVVPYSVPVYNQGYPNTGYVVQYANGPPLPPPTYVNINDHMFSDENPNGCFIM